MSWGAVLGGLQIPQLIGGLELWLRADTGITLTSGKVSTWADISGHGRDATQAVAGNQPLLTANSQNGQPGVTFDGATSNRFMVGSLSGVTGILSIYGISKMATGSQTGGVVDVTSAGGLTNTGSLLTQNVTLREYRFGGSAPGNIASYLFSSLSAQMHVGRYTSLAGGSPEIFEKAVSKNGQSSTISQPTITQYRVGRLFQNVFPFNGDILEVQLYSKVLTITDIGLLANYASVRYAL